MMTQVIYLSIICSSLVLGWTVASQERMVLHKVRLWAEEKKDKWKWIEPVLLCHWCAPSSISIIAYTLGYLTGIIHGGKILLLYPVVVCISSLMSGLIWQVYQLLDIMTKYFINAEKLKYFDIKDRKEKFQNSSSKQYKG